MKTKYKFLILLLVAFLSFILGRLTIKEEKPQATKETIKYITSNVYIRDTLYLPKPYAVFVPDTIIKYITEPSKVDTSQILADYFLSRKYKLDFSNDTIGTFLVDTEVHQNKLVNANSFINPKTKVIERERMVEKIKALQFYTMIGTDVTFETTKLSFGVDLKQKYLIGVSGIRVGSKYNYTIDFGIKY